MESATVQIDPREEIGFMHVDETDFGSFTTAQRIRHLEVEGYVLLPDMLDAGHIARLKAELSDESEAALALRMAMSRFSRTLGMLLHSDIPLLDSLEIARAVVNNTVLSDAIRRAQEEIREGATIAAPLQASGYFPPLVSHMISVGEKTGRLEEMLLRVADNYDNEVRSSVEGLTSLVEPVIIVLMAVVVFGIMLAVLLPIFELNTTIR